MIKERKEGSYVAWDFHLSHIHAKYLFFLFLCKFTWSRLQGWKKLCQYYLYTDRTAEPASCMLMYVHSWRTGYISVSLHLPFVNNFSAKLLFFLFQHSKPQFYSVSVMFMTSQMFLLVVDLHNYLNKFLFLLNTNAFKI